ncbi:PREDICTED: probable inactive purple acid phosphatase 2 [Acropora digitifera]|uniref:probable inactive purple acid phosphatase 2 n=1 Tax=Acropora digitifera TaxID=70779 RepID=UPI00077A855B|nr:PREDICTED: probable inactive purple acid phosphatase 2 [Acropora digitifera]
MAIVWGAVVYFLLITFLHADAKTSHPVPTYFKRIHKNGSIVDVNDPQNRLRFGKQIREHLSSGANLIVTPSYVTNGATVNVSWNGIPKATHTDFIALYCPKDKISSEYLDYFYVTQSSTYASGYGWYTVVVYNMRTTCEFRYYQESYIHVATSNELKFKGGIYVPLQGHIALTGDPTQMRVMWVSGTDDIPVVHYGKTSLMFFKAEGSSKTYKKSHMCGPPASTNGFTDPGYIHDVLLTDLSPSSQYFYSYGSSKMMSSIRTFHTQPLTNPDETFSFVVYGDMGLSVDPGAHDTAKYIIEEAKKGKSLVFHVGDISYARGYGYIWDQWHELIEPYATLIPYMVGIGNHEQDHLSGGSKDPSGAPGEGWHPIWGNFGDDSGGECGVPMYYRFHMPDNGNALWWYSFDYGSVHFVMMSTEHDYRKGSRQYTWLEKDLKSVDRNKTPWLVLGGHRPMYSSQKVSSDYFVSLYMQYYLEELFHDYKVDLAFWGHYHSYERTCAVYKEVCQEKGSGTTHIVVGSAGFTLDTEGYYDVGWSRYHENDYGYGRVLVANKSALYYEWVRNKDNVVRDKVWLIKTSE